MRALMFIFESINIYFGWFCARSSEPKPIKQGRKTAVKPNSSQGPGSQMKIKSTRPQAQIANTKIGCAQVKGKRWTRGKGQQLYKTHGVPETT